MSNMKSTLAATFLTLVLTVPAWGGNIGSPGATPPPPTTSESISSSDSTACGNIGSPGLTSSALVDILITVVFVI